MNLATMSRRLAELERGRAPEKISTLTPMTPAEAEARITELLARPGTPPRVRCTDDYGQLPSDLRRRDALVLRRIDDIIQSPGLCT